MSVQGRWQIEQVLALAPKPSSITAAQPLAVPTRWSGLGCDDDAVWGRCRGRGAEPYETVVDHVRVAFRCTCPSRIFPCKHALALLTLWVRGDVPSAEADASTRDWIAKRSAAAAAAAAATTAPPSSNTAAATDHALPSGDRAAPGEGSGEQVPSAPAPGPPEPSPGRDERLARMAAGLRELDRWLEDRVRTGLADPLLGRYATWDGLAARLVDAQVGGLANRVRRIAGVIGNGPDWHAALLGELGLLHLLACAGLQPPALLDRPGLADSVAAAIGWQVRQADVLAGVPSTDRWVVMGRSDVREDRIEVRRTWLRGSSSGAWAMSLSFAAYGQSLDVSLPVGACLLADLYRYPGALGLRSIVAARHEPPAVADRPAGDTLAAACEQIGAAVAIEPWLDRWPVVAAATPTLVGGRWVLVDSSGSLPLAVDAVGVDVLVAASAGRDVVVTCEWTPAGLLPLTIHLPGGRGGVRHLDIGPTAEASFLAVRGSAA